MAQYTKAVPKDPGDPEGILSQVLDTIMFQTKDGDEFVSYENHADKVVLTFEEE